LLFTQLLLNNTCGGVNTIPLAEIHPFLEVSLLSGEVKESPFPSIGITIIISAVFHGTAH